MSTWSKEKTSSLNVNGGNEYNALDGVKSSDLNKCFNNSFYTVDTVDRMGDGGEYSSSQIYTYPNIITYNGNGYMAIYKVYNEYASFSNIVPTNTTYWKKICSVGGIANIVQVTGQSATAVISQKGTTDAIVTAKQEVKDYVDTVASKVNVDTTSTSPITLTDQTSFRLGTITTLTINTASTYPLNFECEVVFTAGSTIAIDYSALTLTWSGDDVASNAFTPQANKTYNILFFNNATSIATPNLQAIVRGV